MTPKQKLQKGRAYFKYVLVGINKPIDLTTLSEYEQEEWATILNIKDNLLDTFDKESRLLGLNVPEHKCWCGKPAKYLVKGEEGTTENPEIWYCKRHKNDPRGIYSDS